jgi:hypothetical protein
MTSGFHNVAILVIFLITNSALCIMFGGACDKSLYQISLFCSSSMWIITIKTKCLHCNCVVNSHLKKLFLEEVHDFRDCVSCHLLVTICVSAYCCCCCC